MILRLFHDNGILEQDTIFKCAEKKKEADESDRVLLSSQPNSWNC
ncbi:hypothetical protein SLEP1_g27809 [Rubroshorea leprosula]|uniref:Uncharacterized protein n=1 Tax=Rubroshorea leprosula TaxID=152421 RepID=A0AAV5K2Z9_9ROSI|nr:hypothetical protein SLEP1_g27809 [Rubroshorea leprosula]